jgi:hypothetical protein
MPLADVPHKAPQHVLDILQVAAAPQPDAMIDTLTRWARFCAAA